MPRILIPAVNSHESVVASPFGLALGELHVGKCIISTGSLVMTAFPSAVFVPLSSTVSDPSRFGIHRGRSGRSDTAATHQSRYGNFLELGVLFLIGSSAGVTTRSGRAVLVISSAFDS